MEAIVTANHMAGIDVDERSWFVAYVFSDEFIKIAFAHKANAGALSLSGNAIKTGFGCQPFDRFLVEVAKRKHGVFQGELRYLGQEECLIFEVVGSAQKLYI